MRIIIGYGNTLRGEDAFGVDVLNQLQQYSVKKQLTSTKLITVFQLTPELCLELLDAQELVFIDACYSNTEHYRLACSMESFGSINLSHHISPKVILSLLSNVYDLRAQNSFSGIFAYTLFWIPSVIVFWILYSGFYTKEKINFYLIFFAITVSVLTFLYTGLKTQLYTPILVIFLFFIVKKTKHHFYNFSFLFPSILLFFGYVFPTIQILATVDRVIYLPALLQLRYIEFFSQNGLYLFKGSKISLLLPFTSNYTRAPGYIVDEAFGGGGMNGNTGSFGSIFGDMGIIGVLIILPVFITILSLLINSYSRNKTLNSLLGVYYGYTLINAPLIDIVLTHGIIIHIIILKYFNSKNNFYETQHKFL